MTGQVIEQRTPAVLPVVSGISNRPLMAYLSHSFGQRTVPRAPITQLQVTNQGTSAAIVSIASPANDLGIAAPAWLRIVGMGTGLDGYLYCTAVSTQTPNPSSYTGTLYPFSGAVPANGVYTPSTYAAAQLFDMGSGGATGGYSVSWLSVWKSQGNSFALPPSYVFGLGGGRLVANQINNDPGIAGLVTALLTKTPLPAYCAIDMGINDIVGAGATLAQLKAAALPAFQSLVAAGIKPLCSIVYGGTNISLAQAKVCRAYNQWLQEVAQTGLILFFDPSQRIQDPTSTTGQGLPVMFTAGGDVHLSATGSLTGGRVGTQQYGLALPAISTVPRNAADAFDATSNLTGSILTVTGGIPSGVFGATTAAANVSNDGSTLVAVGTGHCVIGSGFGTNVVTAQILARVDKNADGTTANGNELVITFPAGTYGAGPVATVIFTPVARGFVNSGTEYTAGDELQLEVEVAVDAANLAGTLRLPAVQLSHHDSVVTGADMYINVFNTLSILDPTFPSIAAGSYILSTPAFKTTANSAYMRPQMLLYGPGSVTTTGPVIYRIRGAGLRKIDQSLNPATGLRYGEPF